MSATCRACGHVDEAAIAAECPACGAVPVPLAAEPAAEDVTERCDLTEDSNTEQSDLVDHGDRRTMSFAVAPTDRAFIDRLLQGEPDVADLPGDALTMLPAERAASGPLVIGLALVALILAAGVIWAWT